MLDSIKLSLVARIVMFCVVAFCVLAPLTIYVGLAPVVAQPFYDKFIFLPTKYPSGDWNHTAVSGIKPTDVTFKSDNGNELHGLMYERPNAPKTILLSHGNAYNCTVRPYLVQKFLATGCAVLIYDYSGYGKSTGEPTMEGICQDGVGALNYLTRVKKLTLDQIVLCGESLGTLVAGRLASNYQCAGVILLCPLLSLRRTGSDKFGFLKYYPDFAFSDACRKLDNLSALKNSKIPKLFIAGTADQLTAIQQSDELFEAAAEPKYYIRIEGAQHEDSVMMEDVRFDSGVREFIDALKKNV